MTAEIDQQSHVDRWHYLPEFRELVARASRAVVRARATDPILLEGGPSSNPTRRWEAALDWADAASAEEQLRERLLSTDRIPDALMSLLHAAQYRIWSGDPFAASRLLEFTDEPATSAMPARWHVDREYLLASSRESRKKYVELVARAREAEASALSDVMLEMAMQYPALGHPLYALFLLHYAQRQLEAAHDVIRVARRFDAQDVRYRLLESTVLFDMGRVDSSLELMRECLQFSPDSAIVRVMLANVLVGRWLTTPGNTRLMEEARELLALGAATQTAGMSLKVRAGLLRCFVLHHIGNVAEAESTRITLWSTCSARGYIPELLERPVADWDANHLLDLTRSAVHDELERAA